MVPQTMQKAGHPALTSDENLKLLALTAEGKGEPTCVRR